MWAFEGLNVFPGKSAETVWIGGAVPGAGGQAGMTANGCEVCFRGAGSDLELNLGTAAP